MVGPIEERDSTPSRAHRELGSIRTDQDVHVVSS
jgi:hypothetical protein